MSARAAWRLASLGFDQVFSYAAGKVNWIAAGLPSEGKEAAIPRAGDVAIRDVPTCALDERPSEVRDRLQATGWQRCIVVNEDGVILGRVRSSDLDGPPDSPMEDVMEAGPTTVRPSEPLAALVERMQKQDVGTIVVSTPEGVLVGVLRREDGERQLATRAV
jgi:CBS domain-containing protein